MNARYEVTVGCRPSFKKKKKIAKEFFRQKGYDSRRAWSYQDEDRETQREKYQVYMVPIFSS